MPVRRRSSLVLAAAVATAAAAFAAPTASAAEVPLTGYELTWGIKQSYRSYVTGMAQGTFTPGDGATQAEGNGAFTFTEGTGGYDSAANTVNLAFKGTLGIKSEAHHFELALSDVKFDSAAAEITADVTANGATKDDVPLATVTVTREMKDMATTLTKEAAEVFGSAGYEGAAGDPLTVVQKTKPSPTPTTTPPTSPSPKPTASPTTSPTTKAPSPSPSVSTTKGPIAGGTLGWGVKQSFRTYVVGSRAKGEVTVSAGATQAAGNGAFTFTGATGTYDTDADTLKAAFKGAVNFKGHEANGTYGLDLTLTDLKATLDDGTGTLTADVTSLGENSQDVALATLKAKSPALTAKDDVITVDDVTATLTEAGAKAFGDFYTAGTTLDPVDLSVALTTDANLPEDNDTDPTGGSTDPATTDPTGSTTGGTDSTTGGTTLTGSLADTGSDVPVAALGTAAGVAVAAGAGFVLAMRKRRTTVE